MAEHSIWTAFCSGLFQMFVVALCLVSNGEQALASASWSHDGVVTVRKGEDFRVTCTVSGSDSMLDVVRLVHTQGLKSRPISDNDVVKLPYLVLSRYNVTYNHTGSKAIVTLNYNGIQPEDGGTLGCQKLSGNADGGTFLNITVLVPVSDFYVITLSSDGSQTRVTDETVFLEENQNQGVGCVALVDGSAEAPEIRVAIDGKDVTSLFTSTANTTLVLLDSGLTLFKSERKTTLLTSRPNPDFNDKIMECLVLESAGQAAATAATATLSVKFAPVIECSDTELEAKVDDLVTVTCDVRANPSSRVTWKCPSQFDDILTEEDNVVFNETTLGRDHSRFEMTFTQIKDSQFCSYSLMAENEIGTANVRLELLKVEEPVGSQSANLELVHNTKNKNLEVLPPKQNPVTHEWKNGVIQFQFSGFLLLCQLMIVISTFYRV